MAPEEPRALRDDLQALRIEPGGRESPERPGWLRWIVLAVIAVLFLIASYVTWNLTLGAEPLVQIGYARLSRGGSTSGALLTGSGYIVTGDRYISLGVRVPGRIDAYLVEEGDRVERGQVLVRLDARVYEAALRQVEAQIRETRANLDLRRKELARLEELRQREVASEAELDVKRNEVAVSEATIARLEARLAQLELDLEDSVLRAPTNGVVLEKFKEVGEMATPGGFAGSGDLIRIANLDEMRAEVDINEKDLSRVRLGQPAEVVPDAYPDRTYVASVVKLYPRINRQKGTLKVEVRLREPDEILRPDMSVRIRFLAERDAAADEDTPVVLVRRDAVRSDASGSYVWVVSGGRVRRTAIETAGETGGELVVSSGLAGGEAIAIGEVPALRDGDLVQAESPTAP